jgi:RimJ/RimL family protein N-acetyltransferase
MIVLETARLILRHLVLSDAPFILELVNEPSWIRFIGDKGVRTLDDARDYLAKGPIAMYERCGFGLYLTALKDGGAPIGMCGLIRRDSLEDVDIGFAFLPRYWGKGYAVESAAAVMEHGKAALGMRRIVAITSIDNDRSIKVLERIGLKYERRITLPGDTEELSYFGWDAPAAQ